MGKRITIDSATLMNKGFEVIEAGWLFGLTREKINVVIHPQSIVHSMVEYIDGSIISQMGSSDMKNPDILRPRVSGEDSFGGPRSFDSTARGSSFSSLT